MSVFSFLHTAYVAMRSMPSIQQALARELAMGTSQRTRRNSTQLPRVVERVHDGVAVDPCIPTP